MDLSQFYWNTEKWAKWLNWLKGLMHLNFFIEHKNGSFNFHQIQDLFLVFVLKQFDNKPNFVICGWNPWKCTVFGSLIKFCPTVKIELTWGTLLNKATTSCSKAHHKIPKSSCLLYLNRQKQQKYWYLLRYSFILLYLSSNEKLRKSNKNKQLRIILGFL